MKHNVFFVLLNFMFFLLMSNYKCMSLELESESVTDADDMIAKMKNFFDSYVNNIKNNIKVVDKIKILNNSTENEIYVPAQQFSISDLKHQSENFIEDLIKSSEKDLKNLRNDKQISEEKNIDNITKNKILTSRLNIANNDKNKITNDVNEKINIEKQLTTEIFEADKKLNSYTLNSIGKLKEVDSFLKQYDSKINSLNMLSELFDEDVKQQQNLEQSKINNFKTNFEISFLQKMNKTTLDFVKTLHPLEDLFQSNLKAIKLKTENLKNSIKNKSEILHTLHSRVEDKYKAFDNMNTTESKLSSMKDDYQNILRGLEEEVNMLKSKKKIIQENVDEKHKQKSIKKKTIENVLNNLENQLDQYNVGKISVNSYRKDITNINTRMRNLLSKENMIFKKNKIKI